MHVYLVLLPGLAGQLNEITNNYFINTVTPLYNAPRYNAISGITR